MRFRKHSKWNKCKLRKIPMRLYGDLNPLKKSVWQNPSYILAKVWLVSLFRKPTASFKLFQAFFGVDASNVAVAYEKNKSKRNLMCHPSHMTRRLKVSNQFYAWCISIKIRMELERDKSVMFNYVFKRI